MGTIIKANGERKPVENHGLHGWQKAVGGYIEAVYGTDFVLIVNEEGLLKDLPLNVEATRIAKRPIVGNVIYFTIEEWDSINKSMEIV